jgi:trk system potassium uptake protein TrkH
MKLYLIIRTFFSRHLTPTRIFVFSFAFIIILGTLALWLPVSASVSKNNLRFVDALFTSASAVCMTGLTTIDIGKDLSLCGQLITLVLFQVGGLGIITFSIVLFTLMGRGISFKGHEIAQSTFMHSPRRDFFLIIVRVLRYTLVIESVGTLLLFERFILDFPVQQAFYHAVYHAVSAFNNCGYSLFPDNMMRYQSDVLVNVLHEVMSKLRGKQKRLSLHSKIVLITTAALILAGAVCFYLLEMNNVLSGTSIKTAILTSFFQSITPRTAGFHTVNIGMLTNSTILVIMALMFIGASPGSTGGGVKTTSFALLLLLIINRMKGNENVNVANRTIPKELIEKTISIVFASAIIIGIITAVLLLAGGSNAEPLSSRYQFIEYAFETFSAFGSVGLSMGVTRQLNDVQKYAIVLMMFIGRVGPLTLAFAWYSARKKGLKYAEESVMVG